MAKSQSSKHVQHQSQTLLFDKFINLSPSIHALTSFGLHLILILFSEIQDKYLEVPYTDIDYVIFTDGARFIVDGGSPFSRATYRYTPLLAWLMTPNILWFSQFGKILFSILDVVGGILLYKILDQNSKSHYYLLWLYNPLTLILSTRGSAESVICTLVILVVYFFIKKQYILAGLFYGFVIHFKIYPIIYATTFFLVISENFGGRNLGLNIPKATFIVSSAIGLIIPTWISYWFCGQIYIDEAWLFHFHRQDLQHNFSPYFYFYQFSENASFKRIISMLAFLPQMILIILVAFYYNFYGRKSSNIFMSLFLQTYLFVTMNKVITAQYFGWYICLLPLIVPFVEIPVKQWLIIAVLWSFSIFQWLLPAYLFEFRKWDCLHWLGLSSLLFVLINLYIILYFHRNFKMNNSKDLKYK